MSRYNGLITDCSSRSPEVRYTWSRLYTAEQARRIRVCEGRIYTSKILPFLKKILIFFRLFQNSSGPVLWFSNLIYPSATFWKQLEKIQLARPISVVPRSPLYLESNVHSWVELSPALCGVSPVYVALVGVWADGRTSTLLGTWIPHCQPLLALLSARFRILRFCLTIFVYNFSFQETILSMRSTITIWNFKIISHCMRSLFVDDDMRSISASFLSISSATLFTLPAGSGGVLRLYVSRHGR